MRVLVANAGSSSLKLRLLDGDHAVVSAADLPAPASGRYDAAVREFVSQAGAIDAVGHRVVHGGAEFLHSAVLDDRSLGRLRRLSDQTSRRSTTGRRWRWWTCCGPPPRRSPA